MSSQRQTIHSIHNKKFWTEFFRLYESLPALWDMNNPVYKNRQVKSDAYDMMVDKLREIEPNADREDVLRKVNIFRTNFRRECSRINTSIQEGRHYQSTLWYFDLLCFLQTSDTRRDRKRKIVDDDGEKSIMRKRRTTNIMQKSNTQFLLAPKKEHLIEFQSHSTQEFEYDLEDEPDFEYVPDELAHALVNSKNDNTTEIQHNHFALNNYEEDDDEGDQSQQEYSHEEDFKNIQLRTNIETKHKQIKLTADNILQMGGEINANETLIEVNNISEEQQVFEEYTADSEHETLQTEQWYMKTKTLPNVSAFKFEKERLNADNTTNATTMKTSNNAKMKFLRDVKTMTSDSAHIRCCTKLSESSEILAKSWAVQYDEISPQQKILARKAINDILFEGCMGHLAIGSNGRVIVNDADYKIHQDSKFPSNEEVESSEIYEQSTNIASSSSSTSGVGAGQPVTLSENVASASKDHTTDKWAKL